MSGVAPPATTEQRLKDKRRRHRRDLAAQERRSERLMEELHERRDASIKSFEGTVAPFRGEDINLSLTATVVAFDFLFAPAKNSDRSWRAVVLTVVPKPMRNGTPRHLPGGGGGGGNKPL